MFENKTTSELMIRIKEIEYEYDNIKKNILDLIDKMDNLENEYIKINIELKKRLKEK